MISPSHVKTHKLTNAFLGSLLTPMGLNSITLFAYVACALISGAYATDAWLCSENNEVCVRLDTLKKIHPSNEEPVFSEGPAMSPRGSLFFTDRHEQWDIHEFDINTKQFSNFRSSTHGANGLFFGSRGNLYICEGDPSAARITRIAPDGTYEVLADKYQGKKFNSPNDLWVDPEGGIYFTDPRYGTPGQLLPQKGQHVYYITPAGNRVTRIIDDLVQPNGIVGTDDGATLYVADPGQTTVFRYSINENGFVTGKTRLADYTTDGMTLDPTGNIYLAASTWQDAKHDQVQVIDPKGELLLTIPVPGHPTNVAIGGGPESSLLFITTNHGVYSVELKY